MKTILCLLFCLYLVFQIWHYGVEALHISTCATFHEQLRMVTTFPKVQSRLQLLIQYSAHKEWIFENQHRDRQFLPAVFPGC